MKNFILMVFLCFYSHVVFGQQTVIPKNMAFADLILIINEDARKIIQKTADSIKNNPDKVQLLSKRIKVYSSLIKPILEAEKLHSDFQYLMLMESGAEGNFQSENKVGFWGLTESRATEIGLQIEKPDQRKHLIFSTQKMARFFANNQYYLRNVLFTALSHKIGLINTNKLITNNLKNNSKLEITQNTHPYLLKFLAHFLVFNRATDGSSDFGLWLFENKKNYSTAQISKLTGLTTDEILTFNSWILDIHKSYQNYSILLPVQPESFEYITKRLGHDENQTDFFESKNNTILNYPVILNQERIRFNQKTQTLANINGLRGVIAENKTTPSELAELGNISVNKFLNFNDISEFDNIQQNKVYYFEAKKNTVSLEKHILEKEESFWDVAQKYGIKLNILIKNNTIGRSEFPKAGRVLWLNKKSPKNKVDSDENTSESHLEITENQYFSKDTLIYHTVQKGETLFQISKKYKVSMSEIRNWNNLGNNLNLTEGVILQIMKINTALPIPKEEPKPIISEIKKPKIEYTRDSLYILHTVKKGEIPYQIAQKYNVTTEAILLWNNLKTSSILLEGDKIRIKVRDGNSVNPEPFERQPIPIINYVVIKPESMTRIAYKLNIPLNRLAKWNPMQSMKTELTPGTKLNLKGEVDVYNAGFGESLTTIAKHLQIEAREIARWNHKAIITYAIGIGGEQLVLKPYGEKQEILPPGYIEPEQIVENTQKDNSLNNTKKEVSDYHVLEPAQNLKQVALKYGLTEMNLISWNNLTASDLENLNTGDTIYLSQNSALLADNQEPWNKKRFKSPYNFKLYEIIPADYHIYRQNETLTQISKSEAVNLEKVILWNQIPENVLFMEGDTLLLTNPIYLEKKNAVENLKAPAQYIALASAFYVVKKGDNIYTVSDKYEVKVSELRRWNGLPSDIFQLRAGLRLIVKLRQ